MSGRAGVRPSAAEAERIAQARASLVQGSAGIAAVARQLVDPSWVVRRALVDLLAGAGELAATHLLTLLTDARDSESRIAAVVDTLAASTSPIDARLIALCSHDDPAVVADAAQVLGRRRSREALPRLRELVRGDDDNVAVSAIEALGCIGGRAAVDVLVSAVRSGRFFRVFPAIDVLGRTGDPRAIAPLTELLEDPGYAIEAARALGRSADPAAVGPLLALARRPGEAQVRVAAVALADLREGYGALYGGSDAIELLIRDRAALGTTRRLVSAMRGASVPELAAIVRVLGAIGSEDVVPVLLEQLDGPELVARPAADVLKKLGGAVSTTLAAALREGDSARRRLLLEVLQPRAIAAADVVVALGDPDGIVRAKACDLLGRIAQPSALPALFAVLGDLNPRVGHAALGAIQALGGDLTEQLGLAAARSPDPRLRRQAFRLLGYFGYASGIEPLIEALDGEDLQLCELALQSLGSIDEPRAHAAILATVEHAEPRLRGAAMRALGNLQPSIAAPALLGALDDADPWTRYYACQSLGRLGHEPAASALARLLDDPAGQVRVGAIEAISRLSSPLAIAHLVEASRSNDQDVRRACLMGLAIGAREDGLSLVLDATRSDDAATRLVATSALAAFKGDQVPGRLAELAGDDADESVRMAALTMLGERPGAQSTRAVIGLLDQPSARERVRELLAHPLPGRIDGIIDALGESDDDNAAVLTSALARMRSPQATTALVTVLGGANPRARRAAAITAAAVGTRALLDELRARVASDPDPEVRRVIASALQN
jgi:HEAT repeat protein